MMASGAKRVTADSMLSCDGPTTTAIRAPALIDVRSTWLTTGRPPTGWSTFGVADRMRVPSPAARMIDNNSAIGARFLETARFMTWHHRVENSLPKPTDGKLLR